MSQYISDETKLEIIRKIREDNMRVVDASIDSGISTKSIYRWMRDGVSNGNQSLVLENRRLKKEVEQLYGMLGKATALMQRPKG